MASTAAEFETLIGKVDDAIEAILEKGQSITFDGVTYTKANIGDLMRIRAYYVKRKSEIEKEYSSGGSRRVAEF